MHKFYIIQPIDGVRFGNQPLREACSCVRDMAKPNGPGVTIVASQAVHRTDIIAALEAALKYAKKDLVDLSK